MPAGCYHIWTVANTGRAMFRRRVCYASRNTAKTHVQRGGSYGDRTDRPIHLLTVGRGRLPVKRRAMVLECDPATCDCRCGWAVGQRMQSLQSSVTQLGDADHEDQQEVA